MRIATWNIYWLGAEPESYNRRNAEEHKLIARVIENLVPDVLALQEIVDPFVLEEILRLAGGDQANYIIRLEDGKWLTSDTDPTNVARRLQKVFLCINADTVEFVNGAALASETIGRKAFAARLKHRDSGVEFVVVAVHLRSGYPNFLDEEDADVRRREATALARWLRGQAAAENPLFPAPALENVIILGDFNAQLDDPNQSLDSLKQGELGDWIWQNPQPDNGQSETAIDDRYTIDFIMLSPALADKIQTPPTVYAWDYDETLGGTEAFHDGNGGGLKNYKVSDHRPVFAVLDFNFSRFETKRGTVVNASENEATAQWRFAPADEPDKRKRLTTIQQQAAENPENREIDLTAYANQEITVAGDHNHSEWIWQAEIV